jgi:hypothetical protein
MQDPRDVLGQAKERHPASASIHLPPSFIPGLLRKVAQLCAILTPPAKKNRSAPQAPAPFVVQPISTCFKPNQRISNQNSYAPVMRIGKRQKTCLLRPGCAPILRALFERKLNDLCDVRKALRPRSPRPSGSRSPPAAGCCARAPAGAICARPRTRSAAAACAGRPGSIRLMSTASSRACRSAIKTTVHA